MPTAAERRKSAVRAIRTLQNVTRDEIDLRRTVAAQTGFAVDVIAVPVGITFAAAAKLSDEALNYRLNDAPVEATYVMPHPLRHETLTCFEDAVAAYDRAHGRMA